MLTTLT